MTKAEALNTLMKMRAWREWGKEQKEEERPEMPEQKKVDEAFDVCIKLLQSSLPSNLDDAILNIDIPDDAYNSYDHQNIIDSCKKLREVAFKAGAEWMAGQGVKLHGRILPGTYGNLYIESDYFNRGYKGLNYRFSDSNDVELTVCPD